MPQGNTLLRKRSAGSCALVEKVAEIVEFEEPWRACHLRGQGATFEPRYPTEAPR